MEIPVPELIKDQVLEIVGKDLVLVGGHSLAFWMNYYAVALPTTGAPVSNDIDFLAEKSSDTHHVKKIAEILKAQPIIPAKSALTALVGSVQKNVSGEDFYKIDIIFKIYGTDAKIVRENALEVEIEDGELKLIVMHPLHVLKSRLDNLYGLIEKRAPDRIENSLLQLKSSILVAERFLESVTTSPGGEGGGREAVLPYIKMILKLANDDAGRNIASRYGIHVADAISPDFVKFQEFQEWQVPRIKSLMSIEKLADLGKNSGQENPTTNAPKIA